MPSTPANPPSRRRDALYLGVLLAVALGLWAPRLRGPIDLRYDAGVYYLLGTSLAAGEGYRLPNEPGNIQAVQYPPLLPAFVAAHVKLAGTDDPAVVGQWLRVSYLLLFLGYVAAAYALARQFLSSGFAFLAGLVCCLYHYSYFMSDLLFTEVPFALVTIALVILNRRAAGGAPGANSRPRRVAQFVATALLGSAAFLLRSAGVALLAAWVGESAFKRRWRQAALRAAAAAVPFLAWQGYIAHVTSGAEYRSPAYAYQRAAYQYYNVPYAQNIKLVDPFAPELGRASAADFGRRMVGNLMVMPSSLGQSVTTSADFWEWLAGKLRHHLRMPNLPLGAVRVPIVFVGCLVLLGGAMLLARREPFIPLYLAASVGLICLTPWPGQFTRYLAPVTPFLTLCLVFVLARVWAAARTRESRAARGAGFSAVAGVAALVLGMEAFAAAATFSKRFQPVYSAPGAAGGGQRLFYYDEKWAAFDAAGAWLAGHAAAGDVVASSAPHWLYLNAGGKFKAVMVPMEADPAEGQRMLDSVPAAYVVVDELDFLDIVRRYTRPTLAANPDKWELAYATPDGKAQVYRRVRRADGQTAFLNR